LSKVKQFLLSYHIPNDCSSGSIILFVEGSLPGLGVTRDVLTQSFRTESSDILCFTFSCQDKDALAELEMLKAQIDIEEQNTALANKENWDI